MPKILNPAPKRSLLVEEHDDGTVTVLHHLRGAPNAHATRFAPGSKEGLALVSHLRAIAGVTEG